MFTLLILLTAFFAGCGQSLERPSRFERMEAFDDPACRIGVLEDSPAVRLVRTLFPQAHVIPFDNREVAVTALLARRIEGLAADEHLLRLCAAANPGRLGLLDEVLSDEPASLVFSAARSNLVARARDCVARFREDGTYDDLLERWCFDLETPERPQCQLAPPTSAGVLRVGTSGLRPPLSEVDAQGRPTGFDVDYAHRLSAALGFGCDVQLMPPEALRAALAEGKLDFVADGWTDVGPLAVTEYLDADVRMAVVRIDPSVRQRALGDLLKNLRAGIFTAFVKDNHWRMILYGLWVTVLMTVLSALIGTILAFLVCALRLSRVRLVAFLAAGYITTLQGTPILIVLLVLSYVASAGMGLNGFGVAVATLSLWFSAGMAETLRAGICSVPKGQSEAAQMLGVSSVRTFLSVTLPQAFRTVLPVLSGQFVNLLQQTSIVGYIAVVDLTMAVDLLCGHDAGALVPLVATGAVYFLLAWGISRGFAALERRIGGKAKGGAK